MDLMKDAQSNRFVEIDRVRQSKKLVDHDFIGSAVCSMAELGQS